MSTRQQHWQKVYTTKDHKKVGWYQETPEISLKLLEKINATPEQSIIDVGCGASSLVDHLIARGFKNITLVDLSTEALAITRDRLGDKGGIPDYQIEDVTTLARNECFDIWHDRAVFHFLTAAEDRVNYMANLKAHLAQNGHAIIGTFSLNGPDACSGLDVVRYNDAKLVAELGSDLELVDSLTDVHIMHNGGEQEYQYFIIRHRKA